MVNYNISRDLLHCWRCSYSKEANTQKKKSNLFVICVNSDSIRHFDIHKNVDILYLISRERRVSGTLMIRSKILEIHRKHEKQT